MIDIQKIENSKNVILAVCKDGKVTMDKKVYEQKLGTLIGCASADEVFEVANSCTNYLKEHYMTENIIRPVRW